MINITLKILISFLFFFENLSAIETCEFKIQKNISCITISKTPNTSKFNENEINKTIINKSEIDKTGAIDIKDIFDLIIGVDTFQSGQKGQQTSIFTRGSQSNHTLVLLNGIAINDQSTTNGLHDFGQDFIHSIQQIEIYKGSNGANFGPNAIAGAVNIITDIDYNNYYSVGGFNKRNNLSNINYNIINDTSHLNTKFSYVKSKVNSSITDGLESDGSFNYQTNINLVKWIEDNLKLKNTFYSRRTQSEYDNSSTDEHGYNSDNKMYAFQSSLIHSTKDSERNLKFHYHIYDREYENGGYLDEYYSKSFVLRDENKKILSNNFSYGLGYELKYDLGEFENRGNYAASTKGKLRNLGTFANVGYKLNSNTNLSFHYRLDDNKLNNLNQTYKVNFSKIYDNLKFRYSRATGLRNPSLYELYGTDNFGFKGNKDLNPEKSSTNEFYNEINFNKNITIKSTAYRTYIFNRIDLNSLWSTYENKNTKIKQEGIENELIFIHKNQKMSFFSHFAKSRTDSGGPQSRRPDLSYGFKYSNYEFNNKALGKFGLNLNFKYTGEYIDWDGSKNSYQKSTNLVDLILFKNLNKKLVSLKISNLLNERYEKPATYNQEGRNFYLNIKTSF